MKQNGHCHIHSLHTHREREITMQIKKERSAGAWEIK